MSTGLLQLSLSISSTVDSQRVQNAAARMIFNLRRHKHVTPCLIQLHWLPVRFRITYKLCILMNSIRAGKCPFYLRDIMQPTIARVTRSGLCSHSDTTSYVTSRLRTKFGEHAFSFYSPAAWNSLPFLTDVWVRRRWRQKAGIFDLIFSRKTGINIPDVPIQ